ncbi:Transglutaminase-like superfamily protein [Tenacibaculum sp. MAR_2009_124]|uniref:transglutaminase domain-containing protein n=1 Tax=Tenacibaculum sp. MAR_2009_124 TaxID=1250059 RepID=UPI0008994795|nr:transglutaminase domain-containing protein [Tenacibaculum sp. MAR_2009_124]SEB76076.1 Transglutaminase-like superfamily protein [Tenacibaculum sp. MAR_2009_124]
MKRIILLVFLLSTTLLCSQKKGTDSSLERVDKIILSYSNVSSIDNLYKRIDYDFNTKIEKARAIFTWIAFNLSYNDSNVIPSPELLAYYGDDSFERLKEYKNRRVIEKAFANRRAVCAGYSLLFKKLCDLMKIENELIRGYTKTSVHKIGIIPRKKNHVWNAVKIDDRWLLMDVTFGSGHDYRGVWQNELDTEYFDCSKEKMKVTHFPSEILWQEYLGHNKLEEFCNQPFYMDTFVKSNLAIISPKNGEIKVKKSDRRVSLKLKGIKKGSTVLCTYSNDGVVRKPKISKEVEGFKYSFKKPFQNTFLNLYIDNTLAVQYKVLIEKD